MTIPLIIQIQEAALDSKSSLTDALRKAKIACAKLGLAEFEQWVDRELNGYMDMAVSDLPHYRKLYGRPEGYNRYRGWEPIIFQSAEQQTNWSFATVGIAMPAIEESLPKEKGKGHFSFPYPPDVQIDLRKSLNGADDVRIKLETPQITSIVNAVRNILLGWTIEMEKQGILGENLTFLPGDRDKSAAVTAQTINTINIAQVGSFVQNPQHSVVQGGVDSKLDLTQEVRDFVQQIEPLLAASNLPSSIQTDTRAVLDELKDATNDASPERGRLRKGLESLKRALAPAGETLIKFAVDAAVTKLLGHG